MFLMDDRGFRPFATEALPLLRKFIAVAAARLPDGSVGIGTRSGGFLIMERDGRVRRYLDRSAGILSDGVLAVFTDTAGTVWLGLQNGIAKLETSSPLTQFGENAGLSSAVNDIQRYRGTLLVASMAGLKQLDGATGVFRTIGPAALQVFALLPNGDSILVAAAVRGCSN